MAEANLLRFQEQSYRVFPDETVLEALLRNKVEVPNGCRAGICQSCILRCTEGAPISESTHDLSTDLRDAGYFLSCKTPSTSVQAADFPGLNVLPTFSTQIVGRQMLSKGVFLLALEKPSDFDSVPGRFVHLELEDGLRRSYSLANSTLKEDGLLHFHIRLVPNGQMSQRLHQSSIGTECKLHGPLGQCYYSVKDSRQTILLIATGTGLAPLYGLATQALAKGHLAPIWLYHGASTLDGLYFQNELQSLADQFGNFRFVQCANEGSTKELRMGSPLDVAILNHPDLTDWRVYLCGNPSMVAAGKRKCYLAGASLSEISSDPFVPQTLPSEA